VFENSSRNSPGGGGGGGGSTYKTKLGEEGEEARTRLN